MSTNDLCTLVNKHKGLCALVHFCAPLWGEDIPVEAIWEQVGIPRSEQGYLNPGTYVGGNPPAVELESDREE